MNFHVFFNLHDALTKRDFQAGVFAGPCSATLEALFKQLPAETPCGISFSEMLTFIPVSQPHDYGSPGEAVERNVQHVNES